MDRDDYTLKAAEKQAILRALRKTRGTIRDAADLLKCGKTTLYRKIEFYKLKRDDWEIIPISDLDKSEIESSMPIEDSTETMPNGPVLTSDELAEGMNPSSAGFPITELG